MSDFIVSPPALPAFYNAINSNTAARVPSTVHTRNNGVYNYFTKYLFQRAASVFKYTLPKNWAKNYFLYVLYTWGFLAVINTDKFGVIPQGCGLMGYNIFYQPRQAVIANPLLAGIREPVIGRECELIKLQENYSGILDIVGFYADKLAMAWEAVDSNLINSKLAYVFFAKNKASAETFKKLYDTIAEGNPAAVLDKQLLDTSGKPTWTFFAQNLKENYITDALISDIRKILQLFDSDIGIPNSNIDKKERLVTDEVTANNTETYSKVSVWFDTVSESIGKVRKMFNYSESELNVEWRFKQEEGEPVERDTFNTRFV